MKNLTMTGGWGEWSSWSCQSNCVHQRKRVCDDPATARDGTECEEGYEASEDGDECTGGLCIITSNDFLSISLKTISLDDEGLP